MPNCLQSRHRQSAASAGVIRRKELLGSEPEMLLAKSIDIRTVWTTLHASTRLSQGIWKMDDSVTDPAPDGRDRWLDACGEVQT